MSEALVEIDLNVRVGRDTTYTGFDDVCGVMPVVGEQVRVVEPESEVYGVGWVLSIDEDKRLVYLRVDWAGLSSA